MALSRCKEFHNNPKGRNADYVTCVEPIGYPKTSSICGRNNCIEPGMIWLTKDEWNQYQNGERIFAYASAVSKVKVT